MAQYTNAKSPAEFPEPTPFGIWHAERRFSTHRTLSLVKAAITSHCDFNDQVRQDKKVYEWVDGKWLLIYHLPAGTVRLEHELWKKGPAPKSAAGIDEQAEQEALASILKAHSAIQNND